MRLEELSQGTAREAELALLCELVGVMNASPDLSETPDLVLDSLVYMTDAAGGCLLLLDDS